MRKCIAPNELEKWIQHLIITNQVHRFYISKPWKHMAKEVKESQNNECQKCKEKGRYGNADVVHHKKELRKFPRLALTKSNLICLCNSCHWAIHHPENEPVIPERW